MAYATVSETGPSGYEGSSPSLDTEKTTAPALAGSYHSYAARSAPGGDHEKEEAKVR